MQPHDYVLVAGLAAAALAWFADYLFSSESSSSNDVFGDG